MASEQLTEIYKILFDTFGPQHWWPGETRFEIITGAILTQNTSWSNVEKAIANLISAGCLTGQKLNSMDTAQIAELIVPAGYYNIKAKRLKNFLNRLFENHQGRLESLENLGTEQLRQWLLSIKGIGPETADSILLYAFDRPVFVIDTYTARITARHRLIEPGADYDQLQYLFESNLEQDIQLFNEYHALLVQIGKNYCKPKPKCDCCPLNKLAHTINFEFV